LIEMLTTVAALIILLGLMVSLARHVRNTSSVDVTKDLLVTLSSSLDQYMAVYQHPPVVTPLVEPGKTPHESELRQRAYENNHRFLDRLIDAGVLSGSALDGLPGSLLVRTEGKVGLRDAWGSPLVLMPRFDRAIGMALGDRPFFFSAGPDQQYLTREDNLYSYEAESIDKP
jgi:hypothetical protein